jgi:hypothetical protein
MKRMAAVAGFVMLAAMSFAQSAPPTVYAESFRQGGTKIVEDKFEAKLSPENATYRERIKDSHGADRYELAITPQGPEGDTKITSWNITLRDLRYGFYSNILIADQQSTDNPKNSLGWLNPSRFNEVQIRARRIMKVDGFYVDIQVKDLHFTPLDSPYLDSMVVGVGLTNADPRVK